MTDMTRALFRQVVAAVKRNPPAGLSITKDENTMDDVTLFVVIGLALLYYYVSGDTSANFSAVVSDGDGGQPIPQPPAPGPVPSLDPGPGPQPPTGGSAGDDIDLGAYNLVGGAPDIRGWAVTTRLTMSSLEPAITPAFSDPGWPDVIPPGFEGPIQYTVWAFIPALRIGAPFIEMWRGRDNCGNNDAGTARAQLQQNWWYRTDGMAGYLPAPGEQIGFMVSAGDARDGKGPYPVFERSNVVLVTMP